MSTSLHDLLARAAQSAVEQPSLDRVATVRRIRRGRRARAGAVGTVALVAAGAIVTAAAGVASHGTVAPQPAPPAGSRTGAASTPAPVRASAATTAGACGSALGPAELSGRSGDVAVGALVAPVAPGTTEVSLMVAGSSVDGADQVAAADGGTAVLLRDGVVVARAGIEVSDRESDRGADASPFLAYAHVPTTSCADGAVLPDGGYVAAVVQPVTVGGATRTVLAGGEVVRVAGGRVATLCDGDDVVPNATEAHTKISWADHGLRLERTLGVTDPAPADGFTAGSVVVLVDRSGHVVAAEHRFGSMHVVVDGEPATYLPAAFPATCSGAALAPGTYTVLDVVDTDPWGSAGTSRTVAKIGTVTITKP